MFRIPDVGRVWTVGDVVGLKENWDYIEGLEKKQNRVAERVIIYAVDDGKVLIGWLNKEIDPQWEEVWSLCDLHTGVRLDAVIGVPIEVTWPGHKALYAKLGPFFTKVNSSWAEFFIDLLNEFGAVFDKETFYARLLEHYDGQSDSDERPRCEPMGRAYGQQSFDGDDGSLDGQQDSGGPATSEG